MSLKKTQVESFYKKNGFFANAFCIYILDLKHVYCHSQVRSSDP